MTEEKQRLCIVESNSNLKATVNTISECTESKKHKITRSWSNQNPISLLQTETGNNLNYSKIDIL